MKKYLTKTAWEAAQTLTPNGPAIKLVNVTRRPEAGEHYTLLRRRCIEAEEGVHRLRQAYGDRRARVFAVQGREFN